MKKYILLIILFIYSCQKDQNALSSNTNISYDKAFEYLDSRKPDSAYIFFDKAQEIFNKNIDSLGIGKCLVNKAIILTENGDYYGGQDLSLKAQQYFNKNDSAQHNAISANYNNLGIASNYDKDYSNATKYYDLAIKYADNDTDRYTYYKNKANTYKNEKKYPQAIHLYKSILPHIMNIDKKVYARLLSNLENVKFLNNPSYNPEIQILKAIEIEKNIDDKWGQNASYYHLIEYYKDKNPEKALFYAEKMYSIAKEIKSPKDRLEALRNLTSLDQKNRLENFEIFNVLYDSIQEQKDMNDKRFAFIRFGSEELKKINAEKEIKLLQQKIGLGILSFLLIGSIFWYKKRKKRLQQEKEIEIKNTELKYSKKVHDVVANGLYHMMIDVQNNPEMDKTRILNNIEKMYEESRDISHENIVEKDFSLRFSKMISSYSSPEQKVLIVGYKGNIWENISYNVQLELFYIIRELLVNMKKHSQAKLASLKFEKNITNLKIKYTDNGIGINYLEQKKGTGIHNAEIRIDTIGGAITFEKNPNGGLVIQIIIPIHPKYV